MEATLIDQFVIDPPWPKGMAGCVKARPNRARSLPYPTMPVADIFALLDSEVLPLAATAHNVFLWSIDKFLHESERSMLGRGYRLHARMVWDKVTGIPAAFTVRYSHEYLLWFYKPSLMPVAKEMRGKFGTVFREPSRQHSRKPDAAYAMIRSLYPNSSRMDVFSRELRPGWQQWGNQTAHFAA